VAWALVGGPIKASIAQNRRFALEDAAARDIEEDPLYYYEDCFYDQENDTNWVGGGEITAASFRELELSVV
jgi:hypothetical protein